VVAWDVAEVESAEIAAELVQRACLKERYCRPRGFGSRQSHQQPLILHADNGNAMRAATLESRLGELGVLRSFSRPRVSNDNPYSESLFRTVKFRPDYPSRPFASKAEACEWVAVSSSSHLTNATAVQPSPSAGNAPRSTKRLAKPTQNAGANPLAAGANQLWCGSTSHQKARNPIRRYHLSKLPERQLRNDTFPESHRGTCKRHLLVD
jgi:transposase InsO family protein